MDCSDGPDGPEGPEEAGQAEEADIEHKEACRICGGQIRRINTTYCYSNLLVRELATVGIKVEHFFDGNSSAKSPETVLASDLLAMDLS
jgi:hypothetical protein